MSAEGVERCNRLSWRGRKRPARDVDFERLGKIRVAFPSDFAANNECIDRIAKTLPWKPRAIGGTLEFRRESDERCRVHLVVHTAEVVARPMNRGATSGRERRSRGPRGIIRARKNNHRRRKSTCSACSNDVDRTILDRFRGGRCDEFLAICTRFRHRANRRAAHHARRFKPAHKEWRVYVVFKEDRPTRRFRPTREFVEIRPTVRHKHNLIDDRPTSFKRGRARTEHDGPRGL